MSVHASDKYTLLVSTATNDVFRTPAIYLMAVALNIQQTADVSLDTVMSVHASDKYTLLVSTAMNDGQHIPVIDQSVDSPTSTLTSIFWYTWVTCLNMRDTFVSLIFFFSCRRSIFHAPLTTGWSAWSVFCCFSFYRSFSTLSWRGKFIWVTCHVSRSFACHLLPVAQSIETSPMKSVFFWNRFKGMYISFWKFRKTSH